MKIEVNTAVQTLHFGCEWSWTIRLRERLCWWHQWISHNLSPLLMFRDVILPFVEAYQELLSWSSSLLVSQPACRLQQRLYLWLNISHESQWSTVLTVSRDVTCICLLASLCFASQQQKKKKRSCTGALSEWAHFLQRSCHMAVNYTFGGAAGSMRCTPALPVNSIRYHRLSPRRACRVESNMAGHSFSMRETWAWESGCDLPKPRRHVDEDQMLLKGTDMSLMTAEEKEKVIRVFFLSVTLHVLTCRARLNVSWTLWICLMYPSGKIAHRKCLERGGKPWNVIGWTFCHIQVNQSELLLVVCFSG